MSDVPEAPGGLDSPDSLDSPGGLDSFDGPDSPESPEAPDSPDSPDSEAGAPGVGGVEAAGPDEAEAAKADAPVELQRLEDLIGFDVVIDTDSSFVFIGTLEAATARFLTLAGADVHEMRDSNVTKEIYSLEARKYGVRANRKRTYVRVERVVCVSRLEDVIRY